MTEKISIEINNWREFQPRSDLKTLNWIRIENGLFDGELYFLIGNKGILLFIYLLTLAAKKNNPKIEFAQNFVASKLGMTDAEILNTLEILDKNQIVRGFVRARYESARVCVLRTNERTNERNDTNERNEHANGTDSDVQNLSNPKNNLPSIHQAKDLVHGAIDEFSINPVCVGLLSKTKKEAQAAWLTAYPSADWIIHEMLKANAWMINNPKRKPKNFGTFFTNWLSKGFETYRKGIPSNKAQTYVDKINQNNAEIMRKYEAEENES